MMNGVVMMDVCMFSGAVLGNIKPSCAVDTVYQQTLGTTK